MKASCRVTVQGSNLLSFFFPQGTHLRLILTLSSSRSSSPKVHTCDGGTGRFGSIDGGRFDENDAGGEGGENILARGEGAETPSSAHTVCGVCVCVCVCGVGRDDRGTQRL